MKNIFKVLLLAWVVYAILITKVFSDTFNISNVAQSVVTANYTNNIIVSNSVEIATTTIINTNNITNQISAPITVTNVVTYYITNMVGVLLPTIPPTGTNVLKAIDGVLTWAAE